MSCLWHRFCHLLLWFLSIPLDAKDHREIRDPSSPRLFWISDFGQNCTWVIALCLSRSALVVNPAFAIMFAWSSLAVCAGLHGKGTMPTDVVMPQMGESIFEGTITKWLKKPGDKVQRDEPLFEISTDK